jgi:hypothetical protein
LDVISQNINFQYNYTHGDTWASGFISTDNKKFEFVCSYLFNNPLEELLNAVYQVVPYLATFSRNEIEFTMIDEPIEYRWVLKLINVKNVNITIYKKGYDRKSDIIFEDNINVCNLLKAFIQCIDSNHELKLNEKIERIYKEFKLYLKNN